MTTKAIVWVFLMAGFGWFAYFAAPVVLFAGHALVLGQVPDFTYKDVANLGGFAVFALAMYVLHKQSLAQFREDLKQEREHRAGDAQSMVKAIADNTSATKELSNAFGSWKNKNT